MLLTRPHSTEGRVEQQTIASAGCSAASSPVSSLSFAYIRPVGFLPHGALIQYGDRTLGPRDSLPARRLHLRLIITRVGSPPPPPPAPPAPPPLGWLVGVVGRLVGRRTGGQCRRAGEEMAVPLGSLSSPRPVPRHKSRCAYPLPVSGRLRPGPAGAERSRIAQTWKPELGRIARAATVDWVRGIRSMAMWLAARPSKSMDQDGGTEAHRRKHARPRSRLGRQPRSLGGNCRRTGGRLAQHDDAQLGAKCQPLRRVALAGLAPSSLVVARSTYRDIIPRNLLCAKKLPIASLPTSRPARDQPV